MRAVLVSDSSTARRQSSSRHQSDPLPSREEVASTSKQEVPAVSPVVNRALSPLQISGHRLIHEDLVQTNKQDLHVAPLKAAMPTAIRHSTPPQLSGRLQIHGDGALVSKPELAVASTPVILLNPGAGPIEEDDSIPTHQSQAQAQAQCSREHNPDAVTPSSSLTEAEIQQNPIPRFEPLQGHWTYSQPVFARYKKTPYFYSGNIATYLGAGMFMVVFDDGTLDYRVRREELMVRVEFASPTPPSTREQERRSQHRHGAQSRGRNSAEDGGADEYSLSNSLRRTESWESVEQPNALMNATQRRRSRQQQDQLADGAIPDVSSAPEQHLLPLQHVMVDFSITPPKERVLSFDELNDEYESGEVRDDHNVEDDDAWRAHLEDEALAMKRLECGVGYEDDSTQVSDSDDSSEEDMTMTPWQQMTQTFGMGKVVRGPRGATRRSSISSVSQMDRLSFKQKNMNQILPSPKSIKQIITDYIMRGNKKVQPSRFTAALALAEHVRLMETKLTALRAANPFVFPSPTASSVASVAPIELTSTRVVYERAPEGVRAYGTIKMRGENGDYSVVTEDEETITVQVLPEHKLDFLPSTRELEQQKNDLERSTRVLFAGQKVQVSLYPGSRFSGHGLITLERDPQALFHVLLANRIRLVNVPADLLCPLREKKKAAVTITEDQFLVCSNKVKVYIGDQILVKCITTGESGNFEGDAEENKMGLLNGVYSNRTAAVDFADGSTGYEVPPHLISKCKRTQVPADLDVRSLKNAVLMQASAAANGGLGGEPPVLEEGYQVKADHPRKASVESCVVIKTHASAACDLRFSDGTISFEVFPSQMILDSIQQQQQRTHSKAATTLATNASVNTHAHPPSDYAVGDYVLSWSLRFGRYCSAKIVAKVSEDLSATESETLPSSTSLPVTPTVTATGTALYTLVFDYGEQKAHVPPDKITHLDDTTALTHAQRLTNYSIDTMGFELSPVGFTVGEAVMARVHGTVRYFNGFVEAVHEKERLCAVCFDSSERDDAVPFSAMFSVDARLCITTRDASNKLVVSGGSSSSGAASRSRFLSRPRHGRDDAQGGSDAPTSPTRQRRHSGGSVGNLVKSVTDSFFRSSRWKTNAETRRASNVVTEVGARFHQPKG
ncbi:hypothetical protein BBJ28_00005270 [Nothophytophthora sp. Chile5]|nr:hypothetical protein BBJ28_00005270 [Nothophytophthora sp. Chile5]